MNSKESEARGPDGGGVLFHPRGVAFDLDRGWNVGIMEYWESKTDEGLILVIDPSYARKIRSYSAKPIMPTLQYSIIPLCKATAKPIFSDLAQRTRFSILE